MTNAFIPRSVAAVFMTIALAVGLSGASATGTLAQARPAIGSVEVDVSQLRAKGLGAFAEMIGDVLRRELRAHYPENRQGLRLVVSLESVFLTGSPGGTGSSFGGFDAFTPQDTLGGLNYLIGGDGRVIETYPLNISTPAAQAGPTHLPLERERAAILAQTYAQWLIRRF